MKSKILAVVFVSAMILGAAFSYAEEAGTGTKEAPESAKQETNPPPAPPAAEIKPETKPEEAAKPEAAGVSPEAAKPEAKPEAAAPEAPKTEVKSEAAEAAKPEGEKGKVKIPEETQEYTIVKHDTLWDISKKFLKNPFKWPFIWKQNPYIKNPDLIYPGNVVRITPQGVEIVEKEQLEAERKAAAEKLPVVSLEPEKDKVVVLEPAQPEKTEVKAAAAPASKVSSTIMERKGFITTDGILSAGAIVEAKEKQILINKGDDVFVKFRKNDGIKQGDRYTIFTVGPEMTDPATGAKLGNIIDLVGSLTITETGDVMEAEIDSSFVEIPPGAKLKPYQKPVKEVVITAADAKVNGYIVTSLEAKEQLGTWDLVYIDRGVKDGLKNGNIMRVYKAREKAPNPLDKDGLIKMPDTELGTLVVLESGEKTSSCLILKSLKTINRGDMVGTLP